MILRPHRTGPRIALGLLTAVLMAGCGSQGATTAPTAQGSNSAAGSTAAAASSSAAAKPLRKVDLRLDWLANGYDAPYVVAKDQGFYKAAGLDVTIGQGKGSTITAQTVGNGDDTFGVADASAVAVSITKGVPVQYLADYLQQSPLSIAYHRGTTLTSPLDLKGKTVISSAGDADLTLLPAVLAKYGMTKSELNLQLVQVSAEVPAFLQNKKAVLLAFAVGTYLSAWSQDPNAQDRTYSSFGINPLSIGLITSTAEIKNHPGVVRAFVAASTKGWEYTIAHPTQAVDETAAAFPDAKKALLAKGLQLTLGMLHTPASQGKVVGWMAPSDWKTTVDLLHQYAGMPAPKPIADYYTDQFLPNA